MIIPTAGHALRVRHCAEHLAVRPKTCPDRAHGFTPTLARRWISGHGFSDACEHCDQPHAVHTGEQNAARHHSFTSLVVAEGLIRMSGGDTDAETSQWALRLRKGRRAVRGRTVKAVPRHARPRQGPRGPVPPGPPGT